MASRRATPGIHRIGQGEDRAARKPQRQLKLRSTGVPGPDVLAGVPGWCAASRASAEIGRLDSARRKTDIRLSLFVVGKKIIVEYDGWCRMEWISTFGGMASSESALGKSPSATAVMAAAARAAHLIVDRPPTVFRDALAERLLGEQAGELIGYHRSHGDLQILADARTQAVCRSRYTEDALVEAAAAGIGQYVILGAGLDSFAYRDETHEVPRIRVFEVDHPVSQQDKRCRLAAAGIAVPRHVAHVPVDFERDDLADRLVAAGFDRARPAVVAWLGVSMYLAVDVLSETLAVIGQFAPGTELIADYMLPEGLRDEAGQRYVALVSSAVSGLGERWRTFLSPPDVDRLLNEAGLSTVEHVRQHEMIPAAEWNRSDALAPSDLCRIVRARVPAHRTTFPG
ncbi:class I SAM-dependent methyltransferase [Saccharopolyspora hirsuta]|nr:SAM-dependent methyltransferase [Saccharopolyspora hirsuta]